MRLRERLRARCAPAHQELHRIIEQSGVFTNRELYITYLVRSLAFEREAEGALDAARAELVVPDWEKRRKVHLLEADLEALDYTVPSQPAAPRTTLRVSRTEDVLGVVYVLEGATLGGAVLSKRLTKHPIEHGEARRFLCSYGDARESMWRGAAQFGVEMLKVPLEQITWHAPGCQDARQPVRLLQRSLGCQIA